MMRRQPAPLLAAAALLAASAGCSAGTATLHGTVTDTNYGDPTRQASCARQEFTANPSATWKVRAAGHTTVVRWAGSPYGTGVCHGTWALTVPAAASYRVLLEAVCDDVAYGRHGTEDITRVTVRAAGRLVRLSDGGGSSC